MYYIKKLKCTLIMLISVICVKAYGQQYLVTYQMKTEVKSVKIKNEMGVFNIPIKIVYTCIGNKDSSKIYFANLKKDGINKDDNTAINSNINLPDYILFLNGNSYNFKDGKKILIPIDSSKIIKTNKTKSILGYKCILYFLQNPNKDIKSEAWVCNALPNTLMPGGGMKPLDGAILEFYEPTTKMQFLSTSVKKLKK